MTTPANPGALGLLLALAACAGNQGLEVPVSEDGVKRPIAASTFSEGPAIGTREELVTWLQAHPEVVQLPVTLRSTAIGVTEAHIPTTDGALAVRPDDTALGISLRDRVRERCGEAETCALWLEGRWHGPERFQVLRVVGAVAPADEARIRRVTP